MRHAWDLSTEDLEVLRYLPPDLKRKIRAAFDEIVKNPLLGKALTQNLKGCRSYRIGQMRIVYKVHSPKIFLVTLGPRKSVYQEAIVELKRRMDKK